MKLLFRLSLITAFIIGVVSFSSCKKEEPLEPNEDAAGVQALDFNPFDSTGSGGGTGGGSVNQYFNASIDGNQTSFGTYNYVDAGISITFSGFSITSPQGISIVVSETLSSGQTVDLGSGMSFASYNRAVGDLLQSNSGQLTIDESNSNLLRGTFFFTAKNPNNANDSVVVQNGSFQIAK